MKRVICMRVDPVDPISSLSLRIFWNSSLNMTEGNGRFFSFSPTYYHSWSADIPGSITNKRSYLILLYIFDMRLSLFHPLFNLRPWRPRTENFVPILVYRSCVLAQSPRMRCFFFGTELGHQVFIFAREQVGRNVVLVMYRTKVAFIEVWQAISE